MVTFANDQLFVRIVRSAHGQTGRNEALLNHMKDLTDWAESRCVVAISGVTHRDIYEVDEAGELGAVVAGEWFSTVFTEGRVIEA